MAHTKLGRIDQLTTELLLLLWQVEPAQGPCGTVAREQYRMGLDWFGLLGKR
jgi:hypothetical protein